MNVYLSKKTREMLAWVLYEFINTHAESKEVYENDLEQARKLLEKINK